MRHLFTNASEQQTYPGGEREEVIFHHRNDKHFDQGYSFSHVYTENISMGMTE